ncbi:T-cell surface glycoprotein CD3 epsilon chain [Hemicordylus capensis]|uniref:T-cell surface glycoprotein CD3 epsilon chain n=1 Tax=Hemicordylus capensis TaxID=884348 RepID=UPI0023036CFD|nr:T-cell surface glycoprotein CD3 epsilon chain [Hemicordylus capensis]
MGWGVSFSALGLLLCLSSPVGGRQDEAQDAKFSVSISGKRVTLSCPSGSHFKDKDKDTSAITIEGEEDVVEKKCSCKEGEEIVGDLYLKARVCADCVELSVALVAGLILSDLLITLGILLLVYYCGQKRRARWERRPREGPSARVLVLRLRGLAGSQGSAEREALCPPAPPQASVQGGGTRLWPDEGFRAQPGRGIGVWGGECIAPLSKRVLLGPKADRPPPVPNPDYEPIRKGQREVYAGLEPRAL